jgi:ssDNA-specific exonuclease RecJ
VGSHSEMGDGRSCESAGHCGSTNTEPGAVATGTGPALNNISARRVYNHDDFQPSQSRSLPLPVLYSSTHDANRFSSQIYQRHVSKIYFIFTPAENRNPSSRL